MVLGASFFSDNMSRNEDAPKDFKIYGTHPAKAAGTLRDQMQKGALVPPERT